MGNNKASCYAGVDIGATKILAVIYDNDFHELGRARKKTKAHEGPMTVLARVRKTLQEALENADLSKGRLKGMGLGCPGAVDPEKGVVHSAPNLGWKSVALGRTMETAFHTPAFVMNDVDAGLYGEYCFGAARKSRCALGVFPGTGIGGALVHNGELWTGRRFSAFEIGHIQVQPKGPLCGCGQRGCLEAVASRLAVSAACAAAVYRGDAPKLAALAGLDLSGYGSAVLAQALKSGDRTVERILKDAAAWLGVGIAAAVNLLLPDIVVLGGGMVEAMPVLFLTESFKSAQNRVLAPFRDEFRIVAARLGDNAGVMGAAAFAARRTQKRSSR